MFANNLVLCFNSIRPALTNIKHLTNELKTLEE